ncbi:hypothetical protein RJ639_041263, partial [Escallonia herrerae]
GKLSGGVNKEGIKYYNKLIDELLANGLDPFVTLFHWDTPQDLEDGYGGFLSVQIVDDFRDFVDICFTEFGDRVKHWVTINEPRTYSYVGYAVGWFAPVIYRGVVHCHAEYHRVCVCACRHHKKARLGLQIYVIGWCLSPTPSTTAEPPNDPLILCVDGENLWFLDPITKGDYPHSMRSIVGDRLPRFSKQQSKSLKGSFDFLGINYYTAYYVADAPNSNTNKSYTTDSLARLLSERNGVPIGPKAASFWLNVYPRGILDLLLYIKEKYNNPLIYITENGVDEVNNDTFTLKEALADDMRVEYHHHHLSFLSQAIKDGANVRGYFAWSLMDNFEWFAGYTVRFGVIYIDYKNGLKRYGKLSAKWFKNFLNI